MAEAFFFNRDAPLDIRAESAGIAGAAARQVWPEVVAVMAEVGIDLSNKPRRATAVPAAVRD